MYLTYTEWTTLYGGKRSGTSKEEDTTFKRLPFDHCCLCLQPFDDPYCDADGNVFELQAILEFVKKFKVNPVTGKVSKAISFEYLQQSQQVVVLNSLLTLLVKSPQKLIPGKCTSNT